MHGIATQNVPTALRVRPCISLGDPEWKQQLSEVLRHSASPGKERTMRKETRFSWKIHSCYGGDPSMTAVEVRSMAERIQYWRFAVPKSAQTARWGQGPAGGCDISRIRFAEAKGSGKYEHRDILWFGAANTVSDTESAYAVFPGDAARFYMLRVRKESLWPSGFNGGHASQESVRAIAGFTIFYYSDRLLAFRANPASLSNPRVKRHTSSQTAISAGEE